MSSAGGFWGIILDGGKRYTQIVQTSFHCSMAALEPSSTGRDGGFVSVMLEPSDGPEYLLCTLRHGKAEQVTLDLNFSDGDEVTFFLTGGPGTVHLTGFNMPDEDFPYRGGSSDDGDTFDVDSTGDSDIELEDSSSEGEVPELSKADGSESSTDEETAISLTESKKRKKSPDKKKNKKSKTEESNSVEEGTSDPAAGRLSDSTGSLTKKRKKKAKTSPLDETDGTVVPYTQGIDSSVRVPIDSTKERKKKKKKESQNNGVAGKAAESGQTKSATLSLPGGTTVRDVVVGKGPPAKPGRMVHVYYTGRLKSGKTFDSSTSGKPFKFRLGANEVIKGWDEGIKGMKVGGKRKLVVPASQGYGKEGAGTDIPPNSMLVFDVELKAVS